MPGCSNCRSRTSWPNTREESNAGDRTHRLDRRRLPGRRALGPRLPDAHRTLLLILGAWISFSVPQFALGNVYVPANPYVPFSLQTFSVLFVGATLGFRRGVASTVLYLALGCIGLPVFAIDANGVHASGVDT